jgi:tetratricopeptide (TPR) repeat protein
MTILKETTGINNALGSRTLLEYASFYSKAGRHRLASDTAEDALSIEETHVPKHQRRLGAVLAELAECRLGESRIDEAVELCQRALESLDERICPTAVRVARLASRAYDLKDQKTLAQSYRENADKLGEILRAVDAESIALETTHPMAPVIRVLIESLHILSRTSAGNPERQSDLSQWFNGLYHDIVLWNSELQRFLGDHPIFAVAGASTDWYKSDWFMQLQEYGYNLGRGNSVPAGHSPCRFSAQLFLHAAFVQNRCRWLESENKDVFEQLNRLVGFEPIGFHSYYGYREGTKCPALFHPLMATFAIIHNICFGAAFGEDKSPGLVPLAHAVGEFAIGCREFEERMASEARRVSIALLPIGYDGVEFDEERHVDWLSGVTRNRRGFGDSE